MVSVDGSRGRQRALSAWRREREGKIERIEEAGVGHNSGFVSLLDRSRRSSA